MGNQPAHRYVKDGFLPPHLRPLMPITRAQIKAVVPTDVSPDEWARIPVDIRQELAGDTEHFAGVVREVTNKYYASIESADGRWAKCKATVLEVRSWYVLDPGVQVECLAMRHVGHEKLMVLRLLKVRPALQAEAAE